MKVVPLHSNQGNMDKIIDKVNSPADLRRLDAAQLEQLCSEIRHYIVECCATNPGHLASSLGAVDLTVGIHYVYDTPDDKVVFDVGHQAYAHKILTGRRDAFRQNRKKGGLSGFPNRDESPYDIFGAGHASTSISAALGLSEAGRLSGRDDKVIALIGDGSISGGLALEGLNNAGYGENDLLVILNDNEMAIDGNKGALHSYLLNITTSPTYNKIKTHVWDKLGAGPLRKYIQRLVRKTKSNLVTASGGDLFEALGFRYFGPIDGNDINLVVKTLRKMKAIKGPKLLHAITVKGKGFSPAEADPTTFHAPGIFNPLTGERPQKKYAASRYQDVFGEVLCEIAEMDPKLTAITPAMATGSGLSEFAARFPDRFYDVGIEEEHAATFAAGLAAGGMKPYCCIYSSFAQRAYDEIIHDCAVQCLPVVFCFDRAGLVGEDGVTHQGAFDLAAFRTIPNIRIAAPKDEIDLKNLLYSGLYMKDGPIIIRYPRGIGEGAGWKESEYRILETGKGEKVLEGEKAAVLALGPEVWRAVEAARMIREEYGTGPAVYDMKFLKPIDESILEEAGKFDNIFTVEEGSLKGGLFSEVCEYFASRNRRPSIRGFGIPDMFISHDTQSEQRRSCSLDKDNLYSEISKLFKKS